MADVTFVNRVIPWLRQFPWIFVTSRYFWRLPRKISNGVARKWCWGFGIGAARGFFNGYRRVTSGTCKGRVLAEKQILPELPEPSMIATCGMRQNSRQPWPIFWAHYSQARLVGPSLALMNDRKELLIESVYGEEFCLESPSYHYTFLKRPVELRGPWTSIIGDLTKGYYHWLTDALPRLELLSEFPANTQILAHSPLGNFERESLRLLGLLDRVRETSEFHLILEDYYFSSPPVMTGCTNPRGVAWLRTNFLPHAAKLDTPRKFFVTRTGKTREIINLPDVIDLFRRLEWAVIDLETLSFMEQIAWFSQAEFVVAEHGAALTNLLWCRSSCRVLELFADNYRNGCYEAIAICLDLQHTFEVFPANTMHSIRVPLDWLEAQIT